MSDEPAVPEPYEKCDHICLKDAGHVERGEPHFYGYENPPPRAQLDRYKRLEAAARELASNSVDDIDKRLRYVYIQPSRDEWSEFVAAVLALGEPTP